MDGFHFLRPEWLLALPLAALAVYLSLRLRRFTSPWQRVCDARLLPHLLSPGGATRKGLHLAFALAAALAIVALAGPAWRQLPSPTFSSEAALVLLLDASRSMHAADVAPNRIARARHKILDILDKRHDGVTGLIVYAADPFTVTPLTGDTQTIAALVPSLSADIMPSQGSRPDKALAAARELFTQAGHTRGAVIVLTDSAADEGFAEAAGALFSDGFRVSVLGVGTSEGAPIPAPDGGFISDDSGAIVITRLDPDPLRHVARAGGGHYAGLSADDRDIEALLAAGAPARDYAASEQRQDRNPRWREEGPWLLLLVLPIAALAFRRGAVALVPLLLAPGLLQPQPAAALDWQGLWRTPDQQAARLLDEAPEQAAELFTDPAWRAAAQYRSGAYAAAAETLAALDDPRAHYNRGNALARGGRLEEAIQAYEQTLSAAPEHADARHNKALLEDLLEQQQRQSQQQQRPGEQGQQQPQPGSSAEAGADQDPQQGEPNASDAAEADQQQAAEAAPLPSEQDAPQRQEDAERAAAEPAAETGRDADPAAAEEPADTSEESTREAQQAALSQLGEEPGDPATEHWLRRIPDDPGGLLRRKFLYQYRERGAAPSEPRPW